ncbi:MAG: aminotransferase class V-fold PLP-dependent enzyme [Chloroflexota bacterium]|nr:aminotransferase class V-fold PLP-dependent enzyme [Dehalococcoidia bacterium]MDW8253184.1 aminotransferase class V-fold PLP-dependent enzyme [Chloroflexota bacterium]
MNRTEDPFRAFRAQFPALEQTVYLNTASAAPGARPVADALRHALAEWEAGTFSSRAWDAAGLSTRELFAQLINAPASAVALIGSASEGAATVAASLAPGRVVVGEREFRSNLFPWLALAERGFEIATVPATNGVVPTDALLAAIDHRTVLVAVSAVQFANGYRVWLEPVAERAREVGAFFFVDATQAVGALAFDVAALRPDALVAHGYKWLLSPRGACWLYVAPERLAALRPLAPSWRTAVDPYAQLSGGPYALPADARKLDLSPAWFSFLGAKAALELLLRLPASAIEARCLALAAQFRAGAAQLGLVLAPTEAPSHLVGILAANPEALRDALARQGIQTGARGRYLRLGFHAFNDETDVERALDALRRATR